MIVRTLIMAGLLMLSSCSSIPFQEVPDTVMDSVDPVGMLERYQDELPERFQSLSSVVFDFRWRSITGIGLVDVDRPAETFRIVCLNPMGVKLFELEGNATDTVEHFVIPPLLEQGGDFGQTVGDDIRRVYFDVIPAPDAELVRKRHAIIFRDHSGAGTLEHVFAGPRGELVEKRQFDEDDDLVWRVGYYEHRLNEGKSSPQGIILDNVQHGYRLTIRPKESTSR